MQGPTMGTQLSACSPCAPGDLLWRRATLHSDPAAPAWLPAPAQPAVGGTARQWHRLGASPLSGAKPRPAQHLHCALPGGEQHCPRNLLGEEGRPPAFPTQGCQYPRMLGVVAHISLPWQQAWQRPDGQPATREHLLMALADIDTLLIQASYSQRPAESRWLGLGQEDRRGLGQAVPV